MFIWSGFLILLFAIVALWYISGKRKEYFSIMSQRELGVRGQHDPIIYSLTLVIICCPIVLDAFIMFIGIISAVINNNDSNLRLDSVSEMFEITRLDLAIA